MDIIEDHLRQVEASRALNRDARDPGLVAAATFKDENGKKTRKRHERKEIHVR